MIPEQLVAVVGAGKTSRYHTHGDKLHQTVAAHTWGTVALILMANPHPEIALLKAAVFHDVGEHFTGDTPFPAKASDPQLKEILDRMEDDAIGRMGIVVPGLTEHEKKWLKWADMMECALHAHRMWKDFGYPVAKDILVTAVHAAQSNYLGLSVIADELIEYLHDELNR